MCFALIADSCEDYIKDYIIDELLKILSAEKITVPLWFQARKLTPTERTTNDLQAIGAHMSHVLLRTSITV